MFAHVILAAALDVSAFAYDASAPLNASYGVVKQREGALVTDVTFTSPTRHTISGLLVNGAGSGPHPAVLFVHWLGDAKTTNHTEFETDALVLAKRGVTSLLIDAMWAKPNWFDSGRHTDTDYADSIGQVIDLRRALDLLLTRPGIDAGRVCYVGHDFGSMYGAVLAGVDPRVQWFVLMAGTTTFSEWYLLGAKPADVAAYIAQMTPLDPPAYLARSNARGFLFQFSAHDQYVSPEHELAFFQSAPLPRTMAVYNVDHSLATPAATDDRLAWIAEKLNL